MNDALDRAEEVIIRPRTGWVPVDWRELWRFRELLYFLTWRDVKVRYKQTALGVAWALLQPFLTMVILTVILFKVARIGGLPPGLQGKEAVWLFVGLIPWQLFQTGLTDGGLSLVNQQALLTKTYLPRLFLPAAVVGRGLVDMSFAWLVVAGLGIYYRPALTGTIVFLPLLVLITILSTLGIAFALSALSVTYRDFRFIIPFLSQIWMWLSFVQVPLQRIEDPRVQAIASINPMLGVVQAYRSAIFADIPWDLTSLAISCLSSVGLFVFGLSYFRRTERRFADIA